MEKREESQGEKNQKQMSKNKLCGGLLLCLDDQAHSALLQVKDERRVPVLSAKNNKKTRKQT